ncbi:MAG: phage recombination protein Bet [Eggerthellaceae bacterium]|nr:phage recombination protein Bet [Eggerthellaceae bacterium]
MANELCKVYEADGEEITLNPAVVTRYILGGDKNVPETEMAKAIMTCAARKLNPFSGDVNILPHYDSASGTTKLTVAPSKDFYLRRAMANPRFRGIDDGITVLVNGQMVKKRGAAVYKELGETLIGAWAAVYVDGFVEPVRVEVSLNEYDQHRALWKSKPATMIDKVAQAQALRKAFPDLFTGTYEPSEVGLDEPQGAPVDVREISAAEWGVEDATGYDALDIQEVPDGEGQGVYELEAF